MMAAMSAVNGGGIGALAGNLLGLKSSGALFVGILQSRTIQDQLVAQFDLKAVYGASRTEDARKKLAASTEISEDRKSGILTITVSDRDPKRAADLAGAYIQELDRLVVALSTSSARRERQFLEERLRTVKTDLDAAAREFSEFSSKNRTLDIQEQGRAMVESAASLQGQLIAAQTELEGLRQVYADSNVRVRAVRARIAELSKQVEKLGGSEPASPRSNSQASLYPSIRDLPALGVTYADLFRRTKIQETVFELLTQQYELAKVQEAKEIPSVRVLDEPAVPEKKSFPPRLLVILLGMTATLVFSAVWVLGSARWKEVDPSDPGRQFAQQVLTTIHAEKERLLADGTPSRLGAFFRRRNLTRSAQKPSEEVNDPLQREGRVAGAEPERKDDVSEEVTVK
jgi:capsule polysaccharide export protein KpsE/RkpR